VQDVARAFASEAGVRDERSGEAGEDEGGEEGGGEAARERLERRLEEVVDKVHLPGEGRGGGEGDVSRGRSSCSLQQGLRSPAGFGGAPAGVSDLGAISELSDCGERLVEQPAQALLHRLDRGACGCAPAVNARSLCRLHLGRGAFSPRQRLTRTLVLGEQRRHEHLPTAGEV